MQDKASSLRPPDLVVFTITNHCNQFCLFCAGEHRKVSSASFADPDSLKGLSWLASVKRIMVVGEGEALAHPGYCEIINNIHESAPNTPITLYTNGLGLSGEKLETTLEHVSRIEVSLNAATQKTFDSIIQIGSFKKTMANLMAVSKQKRDNIYVMLMFVALKQNIHEAKKMIDIAHGLGFNAVKAMRGFCPKHNNLPEDSYLGNIDSHIDIDYLEKYAKDRGIRFFTNEKFRSTIGGNCPSPWSELRFTAIEGKWAVDVCCRGRSNMYVQNDNMSDLNSIWDSNRLNFIRRTVNSEELLANKMCSLCRIRLKNEEEYQNNKAHFLKMLRIKDEKELFPYEEI